MRRETFSRVRDVSGAVRRRGLWAELTILLLAMVIAEAGVVLNELRTSVIVDWFSSLAPLAWVNASLLVLFAFFRLYRGAPTAEPSEGPAQPAARSYLTPNFAVLRAASRDTRFRRAWIGAAVAYGLAYAFLQGTLIVDPSGSVEPLFTVLESSIGYGPGLAWAPTNWFGLVLRPYAIAAAVMLSCLSGLAIALSLRLVAASRRAASALPGPLLGFAVLCPSCIVAPASGLFLAYAAPLASMGGMGAATAFSRTLVISTALLGVTIFLLWTVISLLSNLEAARAALGGPRAKGRVPPSGRGATLAGPTKPVS